MKKAIQINLSDKIFYIDEDAYTMLNNYLHQLSVTFTGEEGREIVGDIETRISELFTQQLSRGVNVIDIRFVSKVIDTVGRPEDLGEDIGATPSAAPVPPPAGSAPTPPPCPVESDLRPRKHLYRDVQNKVFGGVLSGLAAYLGWDATILRLLVVVLALCTAVMPCVIIYLVAWMVIKPADTPRRMLEMRGEEVTVSTVSRTVRDNTLPPPFECGADTPVARTSVATDIFGVCSKIVMAIVGVFGVVIGVGVLIALLVLLFMLVMFACMGVAGVSAWLSVTFSVLPVAATVWMTLLLLTGFILIVSVIWAAGAVIFNWKGASRTTLIVAGATLLLLITAIIILTFYLSGHGFFSAPFFIVD